MTFVCTGGKTVSQKGYEAVSPSQQVASERCSRESLGRQPDEETGAIFYEWHLSKRDNNEQSRKGPVMARVSLLPSGGDGQSFAPASLSVIFPNAIRCACELVLLLAYGRPIGYPLNNRRIGYITRGGYGDFQNL